MDIIKMLDSLFEKGFVNFICLTVVTCIICYVLSTIFIRDIEKIRKKKGAAGAKGDSQYLYSTIRVLIWTVGSIIILGQIKPLKPLGDSLLGASGILAIGISIAAQTTFGNYISGFFLAVHQPFKVGDVVYLKEKNISGTVKQITFRHTCIETKNGTLITIPNTVMNSCMIEDMSSSGYTRPLEFSVSNDTDIVKLKKIINKVLSENEMACNADADVLIDDFDGKSYKVSFPLSARTMKEHSELKNAIIPELQKAFKKNKITVI
jgi:small-conductance mechanosensitive channel